MYSGSNIKRDPNPRNKAGILSILTFFYTREIFKKSLKRELEEKDVYEVWKTCDSQKLGDELEAEWLKELTKDHPSLTKVLFRIFGKIYLFYGLMELLIYITTLSIQSISTGKLVSYFSPDSALTIKDAYFYGLAIIFATTLSFIFGHFYTMYITELGLRIKISISSLIYRKALLLSTTSLMEVTTGKIVTLIAKDTDLVTYAFMFGNEMWTGLIKVTIMAFIMFIQIQATAFIGLGFLIFLLPLQIWIGVKTKKIRLKSASRTDERLRRIQEILTSIKLIKVHTWEDFYLKVTNLLRTKEMSSLRLIYYFKSIMFTLAGLSYRISFYICVILYSFFGNILTPEKAFVIITCYGSIQFILTNCIPTYVTDFAQAKASIKRIKSYLLIKNIGDYKNQTEGHPKITVRNTSVKFGSKLVLKDINFEATSGLIGVTGTVGGGKSTFLKMMLKDLDLQDGYVNVNGKISYASQESWLFPGTIRQNILFGLPFDEKRYQDVIQVCAMGKDIKSFVNGDQTVVTDKGLNFSKGQQARINLARAIYKKSDIYLLDDVFSALDTKVGEYIFDKCVINFLKDSIRVVVCHNNDYLRRMDKLLIFGEATIEHEGAFAELMANNVNFGVKDRIDSTVVVDDKKDKVPNYEIAAGEDSTLLLTPKSITDLTIYQENKQKGYVEKKVYKEYFRYAGGFKLILLVLLTCVAAQLITGYFDYFITHWLNIEQNLSLLKVVTINNLTYHNQRELNIEQDRRSSALNWYSLIITISVIVTVCRMFSLFGITMRASRKLHQSVFKRIIGGKMIFFDQNLSGNILNRFSKDISIIDEAIPYHYHECLNTFFTFVSGTTLISIANPIMIIPSIILTAILVYARSLYLRSSNSLQRLDGTTRAPLIGFLSSSLDGVTTIRALNKEEICKNQFDRHQDLNSSVTFMSISTARAFGFWLDFLSTIYISIIILTFIYLYNKLENISGDVGLALTQSFTSIVGILQWGIRMWAGTENLMTSVERVLEYKRVPQENLKGRDPDQWPKHGRIEYKNVSLKYPNRDTFVLKDINLVIEPTQKIGIIGRTGAGKSSIISVLFRLYDTEGEILIDNTNINELGLHLVRSNISIIPQDPVLFEGTIRSNLDPEHQYTDLQIWKILEEVELKLLVENLIMGLESEVKEGGANFSIGQRQLFCVARAGLRNNKIVVLDEATANLDPTTDELLQKAIRRLFSHCTILTIAHRLNTVLNSDKIMVLDGGRVVEYDEPKILLDKRSGLFYSMSKQAGLIE